MHSNRTYVNIDECIFQPTAEVISPSHSTASQSVSGLIYSRNQSKQGITREEERSYQLHTAIKKDDLKLLKSLLRPASFTTVDLLNAGGRSPIHNAAHSGSVHCLKYLLKHLLRVSKREKKTRMRSSDNMLDILFGADRNGNNPLHLACRRLDTSCLELLLRCMVTNRNLKAIEEALQHQNNKQQTPIHVACLYLNIKAIKILITKQCEKVIATVCSYRKRKALADSLRNASTATLLWIIRRGSIVQEMCSIICACRRHNTSNVCEMESRMLGRHRIIDGDIVERGCKVCNTAISSIIILLIEKCREIQFICNEVGHTTLITAAMHDSVGVMRALLSASAAKDLIKATDSNFHTALHHAAARGISRQVLMLLAEGALPNAQDNRGATPLHYAAIRGYSQCIDLLYKANQLNDIKTKNRHTAFMWAALNGINKSLSTMLSVNPFINRRDEDATSSTALHLAAGNNQFETVRMLVRYGWQIEDVNVFGESTLHCACRGGNADTVKFLLSCGADIFRKRNDGCTALHLSAASEHAEALSELLQWYRDSSLINAKNGFGDTALHVAIKNLSVQCAYRLTKAGARVQTKDGRGWDSLMLAIGSRCWSILVMILRESPNFNCFSHLDEVSTLSIAMQSRNSALITFLKLYGALLPNDLRSTAAIKIQRWFRSKLDDQLQIQSKISKYHSERLLCEREQIILFEQTIHSI